MIQCPPVITCVDPKDAQLYALEDPPLPNITCYQGSQSNTVTLSCCGVQNTIDVSAMSPTQRRDAINNLVNQCVTSLFFCGITPPPQLFGNVAQTFQTMCPDGTEFSVITPNCQYITTSQDLSNALAKADAKNVVPICMTPIPTCLCVGAQYSATIKTVGLPQKLTWIVSGSVPPGLTVHVGNTPSSSIVIDGTPTQYGNFTFMITAINAKNMFISKAYTLSIVQITTTSIPGYTVGLPYSFQLQAVGGSGSFAWGIVSGALPNGLSLSASGLISGTPTS